jgi:large subunit ribosomal protein L19
MALPEILEAAREDISSFNVGDTVVVEMKVVEGDRERVQSFQGVVIRKRGRGVAETFTVRRVAHGEGVERIFPLQSPLVRKVEVLKRGRVRRAKLYYLRGLRGRKSRIREAREEKVKVEKGAVPKEEKVSTGEGSSGEEQRPRESGA